MKKFKVNQSTLLKRLLIPLTIIMLIQSAILISILFASGIITKLNQNSLDVVTEKVSNRRNYLQNEMLQRWSDLDAVALDLNTQISDYLEQNEATEEELIAGSQLTSNLLNELSPLINEICHRNVVTGAYLIFNGSGNQHNDKEQLLKSCYYVRDLDPMSTSANLSDLSLLFAPMDVVKHTNITTDILWRSQIELSKDSSQTELEFFYKPFQAAVDFPQIDSENLGYWGSTTKEDILKTESITYSIPLKNKQNVPYAVLGIDISSDFLQKTLPANELFSEQRGSYIMAIDEDKNFQMQNIATIGAMSSRMVLPGSAVSFRESDTYDNVYLLNRSDNEVVFGSIQYLTLYNSNTPFENDHWALIGIVQQQYVTAFTDRTVKTLFIAAIVSFLVGVISLFLTGLITTRPIVHLAKKVSSLNGNEPIELGRIRVLEIDQLASAIEVLSKNVADTSSKLSQIINMTSSPIAAFEYDANQDKVYCTNNFFHILGLSDLSVESNSVDAPIFVEQMTLLQSFCMPDSITENSAIYELVSEDGEMKWVKIEVLYDGSKTLGLIEDITNDVLEKKTIEYERDYDLLTNMPNRRAFQRSINKLLDNPKHTKVAALVMLDLDNLKFINDTFGHHYGDEYIRLMATVLKTQLYENLIVSRMSGDEFFAFYYGEDDKDAIRKHILTLQQSIYQTFFPLPNNPNFRLRASGGIAWYPEDSTDYAKLIKFADFAMYQVKTTTKGEFYEFDASSYQRDSYLLQNSEELNKLIDEHLVEYHFQPIVSATDGSVFAYEALMRPGLPSFKSPLEVLNIAKAQSKLNAIERLTWLEALRSYQLLSAQDSKAYLFINSISSQVLPHDMIELIETNYRSLLPQVVLELTEQEEINEACLLQKRSVIERWGAQIALDDFGTGYSGERSLLIVSPNFVKMDMSLVRGIDTDPNRLDLLRNLITYAHDRNMRVIAEGVETYGEMRTLIQLDVDLLQGYYLARPQATLETIPKNVKDEIRQLSKHK